MLYGTVIEFLSDKGYGFIRPDSGPDVFFHITALGACQEKPQIDPGQAVKYELEPGTGPRRQRRSRLDDDGEKPKAAAKPQARLVELINKIPGGILDEAAKTRHPRARKQKPRWRR